MHVMVIGAAGMVGRKLTEHLVRAPDALGQEIDALTLVDVVEAPVPPAFASIAKTLAVDLASTGTCETLAGMRPVSSMK